MREFVNRERHIHIQNMYSVISASQDPLINSPMKSSNTDLVGLHSGIQKSKLCQFGKYYWKCLLLRQNNAHTTSVSKL